ncbi:GroES-like protein [Neoconidiobolus thromboides FSU 785]|nr:GroES-like protein [Neoconidiobolus thromboides FSU 785]
MEIIKGWACFGKDQALIKFEYEVPPILDDFIEVEITHCGICGSDIHMLDSAFVPMKYPIIVGHEIVGRISNLGSKVSGFQLGSRIGIGPQCQACFSSDCASCLYQQENMCDKAIWTYCNKTKKDGTQAYGGYAERIRVMAQFAYLIPENIPSDYAAPLLCAGTTIYASLARLNIHKKHKVGIFGIGGLGHLSVMFCKAMGLDITAFSSSESKRRDTMELGVNKFINVQNEEQSLSVKDSIDYLFITGNMEGDTWEQYIKFMKHHGHIVLLSISKNDLVINPLLLLFKSITISSSLFGSIKETKEMLDFALKHNIRPKVEKFPMSEVNTAISLVRKGGVRYRIVLEN